MGRRGRVCFVVFTAGLLTMLACVDIPAAPAAGAAPYLAGSAGSSLLIKRDGTLWAWGWNGDGQLGLGDRKWRSVPIQVAAAAPGATVAPWSRVAGGRFQTLAVRTDGTLWAWGRDAYGQLGLGNSGPGYQLKPAQVGQDADWASVSCGERHTLALKTSGQLWGWGGNHDSELGLGDTMSRYSPTQIDDPAQTWLTAVAGDDFSAAIRSDGSLWMWGRNANGQLGMGDTLDRAYPRPVGSWPNTWSTVALGRYHALGLQSNGTLWAWGGNKWGQLGLGDKRSRLVPVRLGKRHDWVAIACGAAHSVALRKDGTLWAWGMDFYGQVGVGTKVAGVLRVVKKPRRIGTASDWLAVASGGYHSLALRSRGRLYVWGQNDQGQLGLGDRADRYAPVRLKMSVARR